ncbi:uncharacterized protein LOC128735932 [Sabethes cyaneus]|uniref:uncharacterized protein LOC128735932 n=1 Tax=Sabethes cyaneus TaxID=53552 RepID=UPI00237D3FB4|nr:uncharacterized protein LOC128735932 [Sabethes cyaneus]
MPCRHLATDHHQLDSNVPEFRIFYQNVRGLRTKIDDFFLAATERDYDVIVLTETWLDAQIHSAQLFGNAYNVYRCDRSRINSTKTRGGGVLIAVSSRLTSYVDPTPVSDTIEQLWVIITTPTRKVSVGVMYLPPYRRTDANAIDDHVNSIGSIMSRLQPNDLSLLLGDYNQPGLRWTRPNNNAPSIDYLNLSVTAASSDLLDGFNLYNLSQINHVINNNDRLLDLILTNNETLCKLLEATEPLVPLDPNHPALEITVHQTLPVQFEEAPVQMCLDFSKTDFEALSNAISQTDWRFLESNPLDDAIAYFNDIVNDTLTHCTPPRRQSCKPPWSNSRLRQLKRQRSLALRKYCRLRNTLMKQKFNHASSLYRKYNRYLYKRYTNRMQHNMRLNPRIFWSFVNSKRKEEGLPKDMFLGDRRGSMTEKCTLFAQHFQHNFHDSAATTAQINAALCNIPRDVLDFNMSAITESHVEAAINELKCSFTAGPDGIPGSNLGPLLFMLFINDISALLPDDYHLLFADDIKLFRIVRSTADCLELQSLVDIFMQWCSRNLLTKPCSGNLCDMLYVSSHGVIDSSYQHTPSAVSFLEYRLWNVGDSKRKLCLWQKFCPAKLMRRVFCSS